MPNGMTPGASGQASPLTPPLPTTAETQQQLVYDMIKNGVALLTMLGVSVPVVLTQDSVEKQLAFAAVTLVGMGATAWSYLSHRNKSGRIENLSQQVQSMRAQMVKMSMPAGAPYTPGRTEQDRQK